MKNFFALIAIAGVVATAACSSKKTESVPAEELRAEQTVDQSLESNVEPTVEPTIVEPTAPTENNVQNVANLGASSSGRSR